LLRVLGCDRWSDCPVCDALEIDLVSMKYNPV
jgi:hypothetical protein